MGKAKPPLPQYALMLGAQLKHRNNFTLPLEFKIIQVMQSVIFFWILQG
jgi:hypothetical protein